MIAKEPYHRVDGVRSVGFPQSPCSPDALSPKLTAETRPTFVAPSPKKQPKGRWFISSILVSLLTFIAFSLWKEFGRYQAYGEIEGTVIRLTPSAAGRLSSIVVNEGDHVHAGQVLAVVDSRELQMDFRRLKGDLKIALSNLRVRMAEIDERNRLAMSDRIDRKVDFHRISGEYHIKRAKLEERRAMLAANQSLRELNAVSATEFLASKTEFEGLEAEVADLRAAIDVLEPEVNGAVVNPANPLLEAEQARIADIQTELQEVETLIRESQVVAPVDGQIVKRHCHVGEYVGLQQPIVELLQIGSIEAVIYLPQQHANLLAPGDTIQLVVTPLAVEQTFRVEKISPELVPPPESLRSNYRAFKGLVRVRAVPLDTASELSRWIGAELALPRFAYRTPPEPSLLTKAGTATPTRLSHKTSE